ncbi:MULTISPECIES: flagellar biosynthesis protein FlhF [unclassified Halanaerobium]|uniref:flagellar biosynthesis protein FlhF n=1 Tax=unclassified Halanaerobium TaxID=2641197 RepID=UPI000DF23310|nr:MULTISPECIES: flagellar biosynthesis protein FlhF [unclassified Halanaerobium]RCW47673.1 flagellar biosynthesis protein FlhF [Halanaerobium sp. MA284_MarDTE_T2]RCW84683.1 flagellar biosynthesis protein FlhF [Halanaerobium sp. DL-01]
MKIKKYTGETIQDVIFKVKADLGPEAIIIEKRKFQKGGIFGFFGKTVVEVLAALEEKSRPHYQPVDSRVSRKKEELVKEKLPDRPEELLKSETEAPKAEKIESKNIEDKNKERADFSAERKKDEKIEEDHKAEISVEKEIKESYKNTKIYNHLFHQGVEEDCLNSFINKLNKGAGFPLNDNYSEKIESFSRKYFADCSPIKIDKKRKVVSFIGPTGVGKTTTIAKIAAYFAVDKNKKVGLITADTYRIAAVEQLQTYSNIIDIPFKVCYSSGKLKSMIEGKFKNCDLIFIDTPGSSWKDQLQLGRLKDYTENEIIDEVHLLVSLNIKSRDMYNIIERFEKMNPDKILLTKLDETGSYGDLINIKERYNLPFSYLTFGQDVPEDINPACPEILFKYLFGDYHV